MKMKQILITLAMLLTLGMTAAQAQPQHRNHQTVTAQQQNDDDSVSQGIEAFSDTTSVLAEDDDFDNDVTDDDDTTMADSFDASDFGDPAAWLVGFLGSTMGIVVAVIVIILVLLFLFLPFLIVIWIVRYLIKRHNDRVELAEKAMAMGQPIPESVKPVDKQSDEYLWKRGVRNMTIGIGIALMFWIWDANSLAGVGVLVFFCGLGQALIGHRSKRKEKEQETVENIAEEIKDDEAKE